MKCNMGDHNPLRCVTNAHPVDIHLCGEQQTGLHVNAHMSHNACVTIAIDD
jgi:hypothetical protein